MISFKLKQNVVNITNSVLFTKTSDVSENSASATTSDKNWPSVSVSVNEPLA